MENIPPRVALQGDHSLPEENGTGESPDTQPVFKRRNEGAPSRRKSRKKKDLSLLPTMPLDIIHAIFNQLNPSDLLVVIKTNNIFRRTLLSPNMTTVWKESMARCKSPPRPEGWSLPRWAAFLYGSACNYCGKKVTTLPPSDWDLLRRYCLRCRTAGTVSRPSQATFESRFPDYDMDLLEYVEYTTRGARDNIRYQFYWIVDIKVVAQEWSVFQNAIDSKEDGAMEAFQAWKCKRKEIVAHNFEFAKTCQKWLRDSRNQETAAMEKTRDIIKARMRKLGYESAELDAVLQKYDPGEAFEESSISDQEWKQTQLAVEGYIQRHRDLMAHKLLEPTIKKRMDVLRGVYHEYLKQIWPAQKVVSAPAAESLWQHQGVMKLLVAKEEVIVTAEDFKLALFNVADYIAGFHEERRTLALNELHLVRRKELDPKIAPDPLELARLVFSLHAPCFSNAVHEQHVPLMGWHMRKNHDVRPGVSVVTPCHVTYDSKASSCAERLVRLAGLDPLRTTIAQMDERDAWFVCVRCEASETRRRTILTWRSAIFHVERFRHIKFTLAPAEEVSVARELAVLAREKGVKAWSCNHCPPLEESWRFHPEQGNYMTPGLWKKVELLDHLRKTHLVSVPKIAEDYFLNERARWEYEYDSCLFMKLPETGSDSES